MHFLSHTRPLLAMWKLSLELGATLGQPVVCLRVSTSIKEGYTVYYSAAIRVEYSLCVCYRVYLYD